MAGLDAPAPTATARDDDVVVFKTSWRGLAEGWPWVLGALDDLLVIFALVADMEFALFAPGIGILIVVLVVWEVGLYWFFGASEVRIASDSITRIPNMGSERGVQRSELKSVRQDKYGLLIRADRRLRIREDGFTSEDWQVLSGIVSYWKTDPTLGPVAHLDVIRQPDGKEVGTYVVDSPYRPLFFRGLFAAGALLAWMTSWPMYRGGRWAHDLEFTVACPALALWLVIGAVRLHKQVVRRVTPSETGLQFERPTGEVIDVPFADIQEVHHVHVDTDRGTFVLGSDPDVVYRMLADRLDEAQWYGPRFFRWAAWVRPGFILPALLGAGLLWPVIGWLQGASVLPVSPLVWIAAYAVYALVLIAYVVRKGEQLYEDALREWAHPAHD